VRTFSLGVNRATHYESKLSKEDDMTHLPVSSSCIASIGYDVFCARLEVEFLDGSYYQYSDVPEHIYRGLMTAPSHGTYFDKRIKKAGYPYIRIR
jgi:hypothetical protein